MSAESSQGGLTEYIEHHLTHGSTTLAGAKVFPNPRLVIGDHTHLGSHSTIGVGADVMIGSPVLIANGVHIFAYDSHPVDPGMRHRNLPAGPETSRPIRIEDDAWIGCGAFIMKGVTVGRGSIVGAGAVVVKDVPEYSIVAGNPATLVSKIDAQGDERTGRDAPKPAKKRSAS